MIHQKYVDAYIQAYKTGQIKLNKERVMLIDYLEKFVLNNDQLFFNEEKIEDYINFTEKWFFPTVLYQRFLAAFVFLYDSTTNDVYYDEHFWVVGRGAGKNGTISSLAAFLISQLNGIPGYNGSIVANSEDQAKTSITEIYDTVEMNPKLKSSFNANKSQTEGLVTHSVVKYQTSNGKTKDGLRDGFVVFDEIHQYQDDSGVSVYESGLGKRPQSRQFELGSDGYVRDGYLDSKKDIALQVMQGELPPDTMFPFWCKLDSEEEVDDETMWEKANPMLSKPLSNYGKTLLAAKPSSILGASNPSIAVGFLITSTSKSASSKNFRNKSARKLSRTTLSITYFSRISVNQLTTSRGSIVSAFRIVNNPCFSQSSIGAALRGLSAGFAEYP